jgi:hypothetical protein
VERTEEAQEQQAVSGEMCAKPKFQKL